MEVEREREREREINPFSLLDNHKQHDELILIVALAFIWHSNESVRPSVPYYLLFNPTASVWADARERDVLNK